MLLAADQVLFLVGQRDGTLSEGVADGTPPTTDTPEIDPQTGRPKAT